MAFISNDLLKLYCGTERFNLQTTNEQKKKSIKVFFILNIRSGNDAILLIHKSPTYHTIFLPESGKVCFRIRNTGIWNPGIRNSTQGIQNPAIDNHELWETCFPWLSYICRTLRAVFMLICSSFISRLYFSGFQKKNHIPSLPLTSF